MNKILLLAIIASIISSSCVPTKKFEEQSALSEKYLAEKQNYFELLNKTETELANCNKKLSIANNENLNLSTNLNTLKTERDQLSSLANEERILKEKANKNYENYMLSASEKQEKLIQELAEKERALNKREEDLTNLQKNINERETQLNTIKNEIFTKEKDLSKKAKKIADLEAKLQNQSEALQNLKTNITKALKEFTTEELTVVEENGKIYVSLSEKLLFKPGSFTLDKEGKNAIKKLAEVLQKQQDVDIVVEGHTDSDVFKGKGDLLDNLDLSTKRATSVVRVLRKNKVPQEKIVAAGRGATKPIADNTTKEGKAKNRRTDIILVPNLEKLMELIQSK